MFVPCGFARLRVSGVGPSLWPGFGVLVALILVFSFLGSAHAGEMQNVPWRIRILEAVVIRGPVVLLGEVAVPAGEISPEDWAVLAQRELWPAPPENGRPVNMTRPRLQEAVMSTMQDLAPYCLFPGSMALQRGGAVFTKEQIQQIAIKGLTPALGQLEGEGAFKDFRLPNHIFLDHDRQTVSVELTRRVGAGRTNFRLLVHEVDGQVVQKISCSVFVDSWAEVPCASEPLNRDDVLEPGKITFVRMNLASLRDAPWDGRGGPWRILRPIGVQQVIYQTDLGNIPTVRKGSVVTLVYESKSVRLLTKAEAMSDGAVGENILVRNMQSKKEFYGVIRDASTVVINGAP